MRRIIFCLAILTFFCLSFSENPVSNIVGFVIVSQPAGLSFGSFPFYKSSDTISGYDLIYNTDNPTFGSSDSDCDKLILFKGERKITYYLDETSHSWKSVENGEDLPYLPAGMGYGIYRKNPCQVIFMGTVNNTSSITVPIFKGYNIISYPYPTNTDFNWTNINNLIQCKVLHGKNDMILIYENGTYKEFIFDSGSSTWKSEEDGSILSGEHYQMGKGIIYYHSDVNPIEITVNKPW